MSELKPDCAGRLRPPKEDTRSKPSRCHSCLQLRSCQAGAQHAAPLQDAALTRIGGFLAVDVFVFDVTLGIGVYCGLVAWRQGELGLARWADYAGGGWRYGG